MTSLTEFLLARLAEDEAEIAPHAFLVWNFNDHDGEPLKARVLAQVEALRAVVELHQPRPIAEEATPRLGLQVPLACSTCDHVYPNLGGGCETLLLLVQPFRDHPDFDPSWLT